MPPRMATEDETPSGTIRSGKPFNPIRFKLGQVPLVEAARFRFEVRIMPLSANALAEVCTVLWSVLDQLDAAGENEAAVLLACVLDALSGRG